VFPLKLQAAALLHEKGTHTTVRPRTADVQQRNTFYVHQKIKSAFWNK